MNNYKKNKLTVLKVALMLKFGYINEWLKTHIFPTRIIEKDSYIEITINVLPTEIRATA